MNMLLWRQVNNRIKQVGRIHISLHIINPDGFKNTKPFKIIEGVVIIIVGIIFPGFDADSFGNSFGPEHISTATVKDITNINRIHFKVFMTGQTSSININ